MSSNLIWHAMPGLASGSNRSHNKTLVIITVLINPYKVYVHIAYLARRARAVKQTGKTDGKLVTFAVQHKSICCGGCDLVRSELTAC